MKTNFRSFLIKTAFATNILSSIVSNNSYASNINPEIANIVYWYDDQDIRGVITNRLGRIETSIGYERVEQSKYLGHTGYLKLRINI